ncbi:MAG: hypothetical protein H6811_00625 [Phycisphaeraceae bacterium]|nr:hypothetical protein [Phycisphaeraceae bacterium]
MAAGLVFAACGAAQGQWDPHDGQWGKSSESDLRVMTWNIEDGICSTNLKTDAFNNWNAIVRIVAAMKPDVLLIQEAGDNSGNGTGSGVDSVATLTTVVDLMFHGGTDPFRGGAVTSYVQKFDAAFDMPYVYVGERHDNFNRNIILSRYPFADLNGDTRSTLPDIPFIVPDEWAPGGVGGIRGFLFAEIDLPDNVWAGDAVIGCAHLKAGSTQSDKDEREQAARNVSYYVHYLFNGAGTGSPDPHGKITDSPQAQTILPSGTPVIMGGDLNEDEAGNGGVRGPADWLANGGGSGGTNGCDRDLTDSTISPAMDPFTGSVATRGGSTLDYTIFQDSVAPMTRAYIFSSSTANANGGLPPELVGFPVNATLASSLASDHLPVVLDLQIEAASAGCAADIDGDGDADGDDFFGFLDLFASGDAEADLDGDGDRDADDFFMYLDLFAQGC